MHEHHLGGSEFARETEVKDLQERQPQHCHWLHASFCGSERDTKIQKGKNGKEHSPTGKTTQMCTF